MIWIQEIISGGYQGGKKNKFTIDCAVYTAAGRHDACLGKNEIKLITQHCAVYLICPFNSNLRKYLTLFFLWHRTTRNTAIWKIYMYPIVAVVTRRANAWSRQDAPWVTLEKKRERFNYRRHFITNHCGFVQNRRHRHRVFNVLPFML